MTNTFVTTTRAVGHGLRSLAKGLRRGIVVGCAAVAMVVIYGVGSVGTYGLGLAGITTLSLATSATPANAWRRRRRGVSIWIGRRRRGRGWGGYRRRRRGW